MIIRLRHEEETVSSLLGDFPTIGAALEEIDMHGFYDFDGSGDNIVIADTQIVLREFKPSYGEIVWRRTAE